GHRRDAVSCREYREVPVVAGRFERIQNGRRAESTGQTRRPERHPENLSQERTDARPASFGPPASGNGVESRKLALGSKSTEAILGTLDEALSVVERGLGQVARRDTQRQLHLASHRPKRPAA